MKVEFHREDDPDTVVAEASWDGDAVDVETEDEAVAAQLATAYRRTPVVADDGAYRRRGTAGVAVIAPGDLEWFRAASQVRAQTLTGLVARLVPGVAEGGFDPAAGYRSFEAQIERLSAPPAPQTGL
jgi:hypothetical protein